jgi:hypothetical protein
MPAKTLATKIHKGTQRKKEEKERRTLIKNI